MYMNTGGQYTIIDMEAAEVRLVCGRVAGVVRVGWCVGWRGWCGGW